MAALSGRELDAELALATGWKRIQIDDTTEPPWWVCTPDCKAPHHTHYEPPPYSSSVDALIAGPEAKLRAAGQMLMLAQAGGVNVASWNGTGKASSPSEAEARALAALAALEALQGELEGAKDG